MALSRGIPASCLSSADLLRWKPVFSSLRNTLVTSSAAHRKPRWLPTAPSKVYRVPERPKVPESERLEMKRLYNNYRTKMKSLKRYFRDDWERRQSTMAQPGHVLSPEEEEAEHRRLMAENDAENRRMAAEREQKLAEKAEEIRLNVERLQLEALQKQEDDYKKAVEIIKTQEEITKLYIPREKLEEVIEAAIANPTDYNFAIDREGTRLHGRDPSSLPSAVDASS